VFESWMQTCFSSFLNIQPTAFYSEQVALRQTAWKTLSQLTLLLLVFEEKEDSSLSKTFDHSIRALAGGEASLENAQFFATSSQMAQLLSVLVRRIAPQLLPNRWHFLFQRLSNWIVVPFPFRLSTVSPPTPLLLFVFSLQSGKKGLGSIEGRILLFHSMELLGSVWKITEESSEVEKRCLLPRASEVIPEWTKCQKACFDALLEVFAGISRASHYERHQDHFLTLLSRTVVAIPEVLLLQSRPYDELFQCLHYSHQEVQKTAFRLLRSIVSVENQELNLQEELRTGSSEGINLVPESLNLALQQIHPTTMDMVCLPFFNYLFSPSDAGLRSSFFRLAALLAGLPS